MPHTPDTIERAFALARSGECRTVDEIRKRLNAEGLMTHRLTGPTLLKQLRGLCQASIGSRAEADEG